MSLATANVSRSTSPKQSDIEAPRLHLELEMGYREREEHSSGSCLHGVSLGHKMQD